mmetsp:Transcript_17807/g.58577  ORF Transcript_17807/g.58577 Transcript_17807/m.58577 type:complete len:229 (-) Transcript_17807:912-1598(-)
MKGGTRASLILVFAACHLAMVASTMIDSAWMGGGGARLLRLKGGIAQEELRKRAAMLRGSSQAEENRVANHERVAQTLIQDDVIVSELYGEEIRIPLSCVNEACVESPSFLFAAAAEGQADLVKALLQCGADMNVANEDGDTALHVSAYNGHVEIVRELVRAGSSPASSNNYGATPLHAAASGGRVEVVHELIKLGSVLHAEDKTGFTAADHADAAGYSELASMLTPQ